jgi:nitrogen-specific signal transduction histidine kinase
MDWLLKLTKEQGVLSMSAEFVDRFQFASAMPVGQQLGILLQQAEQQHQTISEQARRLLGQQGECEQLAAQVGQIARERVTMLETINSIEQKNLKFKDEAQMMRALAFGAGGVAAGLGLGLAAGVTGPKILLCGLAGAAAGVVGTELYNKVLGE